MITFRSTPSNFSPSSEQAAQRVWLLASWACLGRSPRRLVQSPVARVSFPKIAEMERDVMPVVDGSVIALGVRRRSGWVRR